MLPKFPFSATFPLTVMVLFPLTAGLEAEVDLKDILMLAAFFVIS